mgnify:CR=1 FL=1
MDPVITAQIATQALPWYSKLIEEVGSLAATLLIFFAVFGFAAWKIAITLNRQWTAERADHKTEMVKLAREQTANLKEIQSEYGRITNMLVVKLDERELFVRTEFLEMAHRSEAIIARNSELLGQVAQSVGNLRICPVEDEARQRVVSQGLHGSSQKR